MSHIAVSSILPTKAYNNLMIDHKANERAELLDLKYKHLPALSKILAAHEVADFVELHLLHRHFSLREGEVVVHKTLRIPSQYDRDIVTSVDIAKVISCSETIKASLAPILWMSSSNSSLVAYEYGLLESANPPKQSVASISLKTWDLFSHDFSAYVHSENIADIVSLKDKSYMQGGEYVVPDMRVVFRVPIGPITLQPGSGMHDSGWKLNAAMQLEPTDRHVTQTRKTAGGTVATYHKITEAGIDTFDPKEISPWFTNPMWAAAKSDDFWVPSGIADVTA
ncbi:hypothetical protein EJ08DRAFT_739687 [Tothia fuscella]|uniref:Uncharacterized protein n=1 Tax=Tothia fuscella TaxID=1048955 RepID=A0A9P4NDQ1_9PEZI|nr:hypothetical protein EJ08DRAFT_739687 [Tothia fuscella]